jgi:hypothetical protein
MYCQRFSMRTKHRVMTPPYLVGNTTNVDTAKMLPNPSQCPGLIDILPWGLIWSDKYDPIDVVLLRIIVEPITTRIQCFSLFAVNEVKRVNVSRSMTMVPH